MQSNNTNLVSKKLLATSFSKLPIFPLQLIDKFHFFSWSVLLRAARSSRIRVFSQMGFFSKFTKCNIWSLILLLILVPKSTQEQGFISVLVSEKGLDFAKDFLIQKSISEMIPLKLPQVKKRVGVPLFGEIDIVLSNITLYSVDVPSSYVKTGQTGVVFVVSGATANISMNWRYSYLSWFLEIYDQGTAFVEIGGLDVGITVALEDKLGTLKLSVLQSGCYVRSLSIKMDGGASWLYQELVDAFEIMIQSTVEDAVSHKISEGVKKIDSLLQSLPKEIAVHDVAAMNITFVNDPIVSNSLIELDINGLFMPSDNLTSRFYHKGSADLVAYSASSKMVEIWLHEKVFDSASLVLFNEGYMQWNVSEVEDQTFLNTYKWRYIVPQLYKKYPNDAIVLGISVTSPPIIKILSNDIESTIYLDITINVVDFFEVVPVACIALEITASASPKIAGNNLVGTLKLKDFEADLKWSDIGNLHIHLIKPVMSLILKMVILPHVNVNLQKGLPLPILRGFSLQNAEISCINRKLVVSGDVSFVEQRQPVSRQFEWKPKFAVS